jgi:Zn-finger nucleic acid-binding protein
MWLHKRGVLKHETTQDVCEPERVIVDRQAENDRCPRCRGVWRNQGELVKLMEHSVYQYDCPVPESQHGDRNDEHRRPNYGKKKESFLGEMFDFD